MPLAARCLISIVSLLMLASCGASDHPGDIDILFGSDQPTAALLNRAGSARIVDGAVEVQSPAISRFAYQYGWREIEVKAGLSYTIEWRIEALEGDFRIGILDEESGQFFARTAPGLRQGSLSVRAKSDRLGVIVHASLDESAPVALRIEQLLVRRDRASDSSNDAVPPLLFSSVEFIFFFLPLLIWLHRRFTSTRICIGVLLVASLAWYSAWNPKLLPMLLASITLTWLLSFTLARTRKRGLLIACVALNLLPLIYFKYLNFGFETIGQLPDRWLPDALVPTILPLGLSFYTFQQIAYLVDVYKGLPPERSLLRYAFFISFFPQLVAGPIVHHKQLLPQIDTQPDRQALLLQGCLYFGIGVAKKILIADRLAHLVNPYYELGAVTNMAEAWIAMVGYSCQLYFDFSGYSDMAMGLAMMFGFVLPVNFNSPYRAKSITDFWRRWHITLSSFLRDYIYIPLGGNRKGEARRTVNLLATMLIGGLWHGAGWAFVVWGGAHGLGLAAHRFFQGTFPNLSLKFLARPATLLFVFALWVPFRAEQLDLTLEIYRGLFVWGGELTLAHGFTLVSALLIALYGPNSHELVAKLSDRLANLAQFAYGVTARSGAYSVGALIVLTYLLWGQARGFDFELTRKYDHGTQFGVSTKGHSLRANLANTAALSGDATKWVVAGPSFSRFRQCYEWRLDDSTFRSGSIGIGGQRASNWVRCLEYVLERDDVEVVFIAVNPVSLTGYRRMGNPLPEEGGAIMAAVDPDEGASYLPLAPDDTSYPAFLLQCLSGNLDHFDQRLRAGSEWLTQRFRVDEKGKATMLELDVAGLSDLESQLTELREKASQSPQPVSNPDNGKDSKFKWVKRGLREELAEGGRTRKILAEIAARSKRTGTRVVIYETATPTHAQAPEIFPEGFLEQYGEWVEQACAESGLLYWDLSRMLPWDGESMKDFCHPTSLGRRLIHQELIRRWIEERSRSD